MIEWEDRRLESAIAGGVGRNAHAWTHSSKGVSAGWSEQPIDRKTRRLLAREASPGGRSAFSDSRFATPANQGARGGVGQPASASAVKTRREADAVVIVLAGELDLAVAETLRAAVRRAIDDPPPRLIVDLSGLSFIDSSGVHAILDAAKQCRVAGLTLSIRPGPPNVQHVFELTKTLDFLPFERSARRT